MRYEIVKIESIQKSLLIRSIKSYGKEAIKKSLQEIGYINDKPIVLVKSKEGYKIIAGNHRLEACKDIGIKEVPAIVYDDTEISEDDQLKLAVTSNESSETLVPTTFVDWAEMVWEYLKHDGMTQQKLADILGWSRNKVNDYSRLKQICYKAWSIIDANLTIPCVNSDNNVASMIDANASNSIFSEGLLRNILSLKPSQQLELVKELHNNSISKNKFTSLAKTYKMRNELKRYIIKEISGYGLSHIRTAFKEVNKGAYDKANGDTSILTNLIKKIKEEWENKNSITLYNGDFIEEVEKVPDGSIDLIVTDPPYNLQEKQTFVYTDDNGRRVRSDRTFKFDDWDSEDDQTFLHNFSVWVNQFYRILKDKGSCYVFTGDRYISHQRKIIEKAGFKFKATLTWNKNNPGTTVVKTNYISSTEYILYFTKCESGHTFNWDDSEYRNMLTYYVSNICSGNERFRDGKGNVLHPTQKPEGSIKRFIEISSNYGDIVFDGFMGVGTIPAVAKKLGRKVIAIEKDKTYFEYANNRIKNIK